MISSELSVRVYPVLNQIHPKSARFKIKLINNIKYRSASVAARYIPDKRLHQMTIPSQRSFLDGKYISVSPLSQEIKGLRGLSRQLNLFQTPEEIAEEFKVVPKVPYKFSYKFEDSSGKQSTMMIEDWEIGMLYFNCLKRVNGDKKRAIAKVRKKYYDFFSTRDLHFFLGTTKRFHNVSPNPFIIIGVFYPPMPSPTKQLSLF